MAIIIAKYRGWCKARDCNIDINKGEKIVYRGRGNTWHVECYDKTGESTGIYGVDPGNDAEARLARREIAHDNSEYAKGIQDVETFNENRRWFGEEQAERMEIEKELREGWDY